MQAIETQYKGYRFRSRLEARWAVFFDWINQKYLYEPEGFVLNNGNWYLPDFLVEMQVMMPNMFNEEYADIGKFDIYIEIKPTKEHADDAGSALWNNFDGNVIISTGQPGWQQFITLMPWHDTTMWSRIGIYKNSACLVLYPPELPYTALYGMARDLYTSKKLHLASIKARGSRFEHGESGAR